MPVDYRIQAQHKGPAQVSELVLEKGRWLCSARGPPVGKRNFLIAYPLSRQGFLLLV